MRYLAYLGNLGELSINRFKRDCQFDEALLSIKLLFTSSELEIRFKFQ